MKNKLLCFAALLSVPGIAPAYLGDFEAQDGYLGMFSNVITPQPFPGDWQDGSGYVPAALGYSPPPHLYERAGPDVSRYNAGQYGTNNGGSGGNAVDLADNTGIWTALAGGRLAVDNSNGSTPLNFITAHGGPAYSGSDFLAIRAIDELLIYNYSVDSRDFSGISPLSISDGVYDVGFWFCPGQVISPGGSSANIFGLNFQDGVGTSGFGFGYNGQGQIQFDLGGAGTWSTSAVTVGANDWSYASMQFNTGTDTVSMTITPWDDLSSSLGSAVQILSNQAMTADMGAFQNMNWRLNAGMDKNFFDNFSMTATPVPEPGGALLAAMAGLRLCFIRRRRYP